MDSHQNSLISVIIPCYNQGEFLGQAIESVLAQTYQHFEIIVVDDGSVDHTKPVAGKYAAVRYHLQQNLGPSHSRNNGLHVSKGEYVVFLDADDRLMTNALEVGIQCLSLHPECAFVSGHICLISRDGSAISTPAETCVLTDHYLELLQYNYIWTPAVVMYRRTVFDEVHGFSPAHFGAEDWELYLRITRRFPVFCHDSVVAEHRVHDEKLTANSARMLKDSLAALRAQRQYIRGNKHYEAALRLGVKKAQSYYGDPLCEEIRKRFTSGQWKKGLEELLLLMRYNPGRLVKCVQS